METWARLRPEPARLRKAISRRDRRQLAAIARRLLAAIGTTDATLRSPTPEGESHGGPLRASGYLKLARAAEEFGVHSKTLERWLEQECPEALFKRRRLTLIVREPYEAWKSRHHVQRMSGNQ